MISNIEYESIHQLLCGCSATIQDYLLRDNELMKSFYNQYIALSHEAFIREELKNEIDSTIQAFYNAKILKQCHFSNNHFVDGTEIICEAEGKSVKAILTLTPKEIGVTIMSPFTANLNSRIYGLAPEIFTEEPIPCSRANDKGEKCIKLMIAKEIFRRLS